MASRLHRLLRIIRMVRKPRYPSVQDLCSALDVKQRTIFNDLKELKELLGVDIRFDRSHNGYYLDGNDFQLSFWGLDEETAMLLLAACRIVSKTSGDQFAQPLVDMFSDEIRICLSEHWSPEGKADEIIGVDVAAAIVSRQCFLALCRASAKKQEMVVILKSKERIVGIPAGLTYKLTGWQFAMHDGRVFPVSEIEDCHPYGASTDSADATRCSDETASCSEEQ